MHRVTLSDGSTVRIHFIDWTEDEWSIRRRFRWTVRDAGGSLLGSGADLFGGSQVRTTEKEMAAAFAGFVGAFAEAHAYGRVDSENRDLLPLPMIDWAVRNADELWSLTYAGEAEECDA